jgi:hypothetical protein
MALIFSQLVKAALSGRAAHLTTKASIEWFRQQASKVTMVNNAKLFNAGADNLRNLPPKIGSMYMFNYDPKTKKDLPYYDTYPLIFPIEPYNDGFLGLNLHYLPPILRAKLMDGLYAYLNNLRMDETTRLQISYKILKGASKLSMFKPCVKHYLTSHIRSRLLYVEPTEWNVALFLPTERFQKATKEKVHRDSRAKI